MELIFQNNFFSPEHPGIYEPLRQAIFEQGDRYMHMADLRGYADCQERIATLYRDPEAWSRMAILNIARMGKFSSDRTIRQYAEEIWNVKPVPVDMKHKHSDTLIQAMVHPKVDNGNGE